MAREYPTDDASLSRVPGVGEKKRRDHGGRFTAAIAEHLSQNPRQTFAQPMQPARGPMFDTVADSVRYFITGRSVSEIAAFRGLRASTILSHLAKGIEAGAALDVSAYLSAEAEMEINVVFDELGTVQLSPVKERVGERFTYGQLRLALALRPK